MIKAVRGTKDIFGEDVRRLQRVEEIIRLTCDSFGFNEMRTPIFEETALFVRGVGEGTDIVQKEMYTFRTKGETSVTLRPEGTAPVVRAFIEHGIYSQPQPTKIYYIISCFRYEKPQAGRQRQFHQFGTEILGVSSPMADAEIISIAHHVLEKLGVKSVKLYINNLGTKESRAAYLKVLAAYFREGEGELCETCKTRLNSNTLRILDCKAEPCSKLADNAPSILDSMDDDGREYFGKLKNILTSMGIAFEVNDRIVRGLDYYTRTVFEFVSDSIGAQGTVCGGGRYDNMIAELGGPDMSGIGFGMGMERLMLAMDPNCVALSGRTDIFIGYIGGAGMYEAQGLVYRLRTRGIHAESDSAERSVKAQLKYANKLGARYSAIIGDDEAASRVLKIKNMETGEATDVEFDGIVNFLYPQGAPFFERMLHGAVSDTKEEA
ncbi:MAG: histidine--tRNA ligase [Defluviitaleaceae bacterium]|nr:histidine--tRNA ligase [Defluviitaleaceae bacterium]